MKFVNCPASFLPVNFFLWEGTAWGMGMQFIDKGRGGRSQVRGVEFNTT